jgi:nitrogen fixation NifU-like protein
MAYSDKVVDHYNNPRNVGSLDKKDPSVGTGLVGAPECGDVDETSDQNQPRNANN